MILADTLTQLTTMTATGLAVVLTHSGVKGQVFKTAKFLGMTNGGEFCYSVTFHDKETQNEDARTKVFVKYNTGTGVMTATM